MAAACVYFGYFRASTARNFDADDIGPSIEIEVPIPTNVQHDPELATRGSVAGGRDDQAKFFGKRVAEVASRSTEESARGMGTAVVVFRESEPTLRLFRVGREEAVSDAGVGMRHMLTGS